MFFIYICKLCIFFVNPNKFREIYIFSSFLSIYWLDYVSIYTNQADNFGVVQPDLWG